MFQSCALYWPEEYGYTEEHGPLSVELLSSSDVDPDVTIRIFKLSHHGRVSGLQALRAFSEDLVFKYLLVSVVIFRF